MKELIIRAGGPNTGMNNIRCCEAFMTKLAMKEILPHPEIGYMMYMTDNSGDFPPMLNKIEYCPFCGAKHDEVFDKLITGLFG